MQSPQWCEQLSKPFETVLYAESVSPTRFLDSFLHLRKLEQTEESGRQRDVESGTLRRVWSLTPQAEPLAGCAVDGESGMRCREYVVIELVRFSFLKSCTMERSSLRSSKAVVESRSGSAVCAVSKWWSTMCVAEITARV